MKRARGFTLTELMLVVAIVGVLAALGTAMLRSTPRASDGASQISSKLAETSRKAVAGGAVRGEVAAALGSTARTRARFDVTSGGVVVTVERLEEDPAPATSASWVALSSITLHQVLRLAGYTPTADLTGGGTPTVPLGTGGSFEVQCHPGGTCDGVTIYLTDAKGRSKARIVVLPLGGTPMTFDRW